MPLEQMDPAIRLALFPFLIFKRRFSLKLGALEFILGTF